MNFQGFCRRCVMMISEIEKLRAIHQRDMENALLWWAEHTNEQKKRVYDLIQKDGLLPEIEIVLRFAQIGYTQVCIDAYDRAEAAGGG